MTGDMLYRQCTCCGACDLGHIEGYVMRSLKLSFVKGVRKFSLTDMFLVLTVSSQLHGDRVLSKSSRWYTEPCERRVIILNGYRVRRELYQLCFEKEARSIQATKNQVSLSHTLVSGISVCHLGAEWHFQSSTFVPSIRVWRSIAHS